MYRGSRAKKLRKLLKILEEAKRVILLKVLTKPPEFVWATFAMESAFMVFNEGQYVESGGKALE